MTLVEMSTKYELATELRMLNRGMKALPICRMKKHELEMEIDRIKKLKAVEVAEHAPAKPGPVGPREMPLRTVVREGVTVTVPEVPKRRIVRASDAIKQHGPGVVSFTDPVTVTPAAAAAPVRTHRCNCPKCPERTAAAST